MSEENVKVCVRFRPLSQRERDTGLQAAWNVFGNSIELCNNYDSRQSGCYSYSFGKIIGRLEFIFVLLLTKKIMFSSLLIY